MFGRVFCLGLLLTTTHALASNSQEDIERQCKSVREKEPTYNIPFSSAMTAYVQLTIIKTAQNYDGSPDATVDKSLMERLTELRKPQYKIYLDQQLNIMEKTLQRAAAELRQHSEKATADKTIASGNCYVSKMLTDPNSDAFEEAIKILDETISFAQHDLERKEESKQAKKYMEDVRVAEVASRQREAAKARSDEKRRQNPRSNTAQINSFTVTANSCTTSAKVGIENAGLEPQSQPGTKFLVLDATFKNTSNASQYYIEPGALLVNYGGKTYAYDSVETIFDMRYSLPIKPINPLVSYRAKLVYRIPSELTGTVRWQPGQNPERATLQCGSI